MQAVSAVVQRERSILGENGRVPQIFASVGVLQFGLNRWQLEKVKDEDFLVANGKVLSEFVAFEALVKGIKFHSGNLDRLQFIENRAVGAVLGET